MSGCISPRRDTAKAGLRAKEIAHLTWWMTNDTPGQVGRAMCLLDSASKGKSGRMIPLSEDVREALVQYRDEVKHLTGFTSSRRKGRLQHRRSHREHVPALVWTSRLRRLFEPFRLPHFHHQRGPENLDDGRLAPRCADACWPLTRISGPRKGTSMPTRKRRCESWSSFSRFACLDAHRYQICPKERTSSASPIPSAKFQKRS